MTIENDTERPSLRDKAILCLQFAGWAGITAGSWLVWGAGVACMVGGAMLLTYGVVADLRGD